MWGLAVNKVRDDRKWSMQRDTNLEGVNWNATKTFKQEFSADQREYSVDVKEVIYNVLWLICKIFSLLMFNFCGKNIQQIKYY